MVDVVTSPRGVFVIVFAVMTASALSVWLGFAGVQ
jgi:hypothetical protein